MSPHIDLDHRGRELLIRFDYDARLVEAVRQLPGRRFDPRAKLWAVPAKHVEAVVGALLPHGFALAPEVRGMIKEPPLPTVGPAAVGGAADPGMSPTAPAALTVAALNARARDALHGAFPDSVWVVGEVLDFDKSAGRRHRFFTLVDKVAGESRPRAQVEVALFESKADELAHKLAAADPPLQLRDGVEIRVLGRVDLYHESGRFQLVIEDIDPEHTLGKMARSREQLLRELRANGLDGKNLALPAPRPILRLAVLASDTSDGWHDFVRQLQSAGVAFAVTLYPVRVQGSDLRRTMLAGLAHFAARPQDHDVLCILRGGGSRIDLSGFDDAAVAYAVARHPLKVLIGIGHERDRTVLDHIAQSFKTPTAVAAFLVDQAVQEWQGLVARGRSVSAAAIDLLAVRRRGLQARAAGLQTGLAGRLLAQRHALALAAQDLHRLALSERVAAERHRTALAGQRLRHGAGASLRDEAAALANAGKRLQHSPVRLLEHAQARVAKHELRARLLDPRAVLRRGYTMVRRPDGGRIVTDAAALAAGIACEIQFRDGFVRADVATVTLTAPPLDHEELP